MTDAQQELGVAIPAQRPAPEEPAVDVLSGRRDRWVWPVLGLIAAVAGLAYGWGANTDGAETYYAGAVRTMSRSWSAFFFGGFDPSGTLTLDKLPGSFWLQALVVRGFGLHTWCLAAPQIAAGVGTVVVMFVAVRRLTGPCTGILAAAITAALPATAVMSRGNTADAVSVLLLVLAAAAATKALRTGRLIMAAVWIGLAFQAKMIESWAIGPGLLAAYLVAAPGSLRRRLRTAGVAGAIMVTVSLSYMSVVALTPAAHRPYVDGSTDNSIYQQVFEFNGVERLGAPGSGFGLGAAVTYTPTPYSIEYTEDAYPEQVPPSSVSRPGPFRLVRGSLGRDVGWLLPVAMICLVALLFATRRRPRTDLVRAGAILWGFWLVTFTFVFTNSTEVLSYYTGLLVPPIAALCALGLRTLYRSLRKRRADAVTTTAYAFALAVSAGTAPLLLRGAPVGVTVLVATALGVTACGIVVAVIGGTRLRRAGLLATAASLLLAPALSTGALVAGHAGSFDAPYSVGGTLQQQSAELARERAAGTAPSRPPTYGGVVYPSLDQDVWTYLDGLRFAPITRDNGRRIVIFTSAEASTYVLAGVANIEVIGGYSGLVDQPTVATLRGQLAAGEIGFAIVPGDGDVRSADPRIRLIETGCRRVYGGDRKTMAAQEYDCSPAP